LAASLAVLLAGCAAGQLSGGSGPALESSASGPAGGHADAVRVVLRVDDDLATATLADSAAAREFVALLPLELDLRDPMGQAKSGPLPRPLDTSGKDTVTDPAVGQVYYAAPSRTFAVFYADLDHPAF
jgi:hypothetical protein